jgi:hypothetical protein
VAGFIQQFAYLALFYFRDFSVAPQRFISPSNLAIELGRQIWPPKRLVPNECLLPKLIWADIALRCGERLPVLRVRLQAA